MSSTQAEIDAAEPEVVETDPNFSAERTVANRDGKDHPAMSIAWGSPKRTMIIRELGLGDQFDLVELAGDQSTNPTWMAMAGVAMGSLEIDGVQVARISKRIHIKPVLDRIKPDGLSAYFKALEKLRPSEEAIVDTAKN